MLFGLFPRSPHALRVVETFGAVVIAPGGDQHVQRTWTVAAASETIHSKITKLSLECPGLTVVRVNPDLQCEHPSGGVAAVVRVTSDAPHHASAVRVSLKRRRSELRVCFKNRRAKGPSDVGTLVVEIELARGALVDELVAKAGGDVVVSPGVLAQCEAAAGGSVCDAESCGVGVVAFDRGRLFVDETDADARAFCELGVGSLHGARVYVSASHLHVRELLGSSVVGSGSVHIHAERTTTKHIKMGVIGHLGSATLSVADALDVEEMEAFVWGEGLVAVDAARGAGIACQTLALQVEGHGAIDASDVQATQAGHVRIRGHGCVALQAPPPDGELVLDCDVCATVQCIGASPRSSRLESAECRVLYATHKSRVSAARPCPPTFESAFENPTEIRAQRAGFRERHLRPLLGFH